jgi:DNA-binding response OmpR family regulator
MPKKISYDVFLIEDDPFLYKVLSKRLEQEGVRVKVATDGESAIRLLKTLAPKLILLDLILPKKSGFEVLAELKKTSLTKKLPVLILSNLGQQDDVHQVTKFGVQEYLVKADYSLSEIVEKVKSYLKN